MLYPGVSSSCERPVKKAKLCRHPSIQLSRAIRTAAIQSASYAAMRKKVIKHHIGRRWRRRRRLRQPRTRRRRRRRRQPEETQTETETSGDGESRGRTRTRRRRRRQPQETEIETETSGDGDSRGRTRTRRQRRRRRRKRAETETETETAGDSRRRRRRQTQPDAETVMERAPKRQNDPSLTGDGDPHRRRQPQPDKAFKAKYLEDIKDEAFRADLDARFAYVKAVYKQREEEEKERRLALADPLFYTKQERRRIEVYVENEYQKIQKSGQSCTHSDASWGGPAEDYIRSELRELGIISRATPSEQRELEIISVTSESWSSDTRSPVQAESATKVQAEQAPQPCC